MIAVEFQEIIRKLYGAYGMLKDTSEQRTWYEQLKDFDYSDVNNAVNDYISVNNRRPTPADIISGAKRYLSERRARRDYHIERLSKCPYCNDRGLVVTITPTGIRQGRPCEECPMGRKNYPMYFLTEEEREAVIKDEEKRGLHPPRKYHEAPKEFYMEYCYGTSK